MDIITALSVLSNVKSALELASTVSRYVQRNSVTAHSDELKPGFLSYAEKKQALETTYKEWEHIAVALEPSINAELQKCSPGTLSERAELLAKFSKAHAELEHESRRRELERLHLHHSAFVIEDGSLKLKLGLSQQTKSLSGVAVEVPRGSLVTAAHQDQFSSNPNGGDMSLPKFKVTMLGDSGAGKTVFMSSMYARMREGHHGISIRAISNDVDLELGQNIENIYGYNNWPPGTDVDEKTYEFELRLREQPIALIDWVDYRGGALLEPEDSPGGKVLIERLRNSHSVIWMIDMSRLKKDSYNTMPARLTTRVGRMSNLCRNATAEQCHLRSLLFVRTKADEVKNGSKGPDWDKACEELISHLGPTRNFDNVPFSAVIPVSSVGQLDTDKKVFGEDPHNVEWPLILSLAFMMEADLKRLKQRASDAHSEYNAQRPGQAVQFFKEILGIGASQAELQAFQQFSSISRQVLGMREVITGLLRHTPKSIKLFER